MNNTGTLWTIMEQSLTRKAISEKIRDEFELKKNESYKLTLKFHD